MLALLFDLDGTLVDSAPDLLAALGDLLVAHGRRRLSEPELVAMVGHGARPLIARAWAATGPPATDADLDRLYPRFLDLYTPRSADRTRPYPGVVTTLERLRHHPLAIVTNKPEAPTHHVLDHLDLARFFGAVVGGDTLPVRKPDPAVLRLALARLDHVGPAVLVGDSETDVATARAAGLPVIGVSWGYARGPLAADVVIDRFTDLPDALTALTR